MNEVPVLVVGAGPAGLTTAITLARQGIDCMIVERRLHASTLPRATLASLRTMELVRSWGLEEAVQAGSNAVEMRLLECRTLAEASSGTAHDIGLPTTEQSEMLSPTTPVCVPQDHLEAVMLDHLAALPTARLQRGVEAIGLSSDSDTTRVTVRDQHGAVSSIDARYVVAADGAHSPVRTAVGISMHGPDHLFELIAVEFRAPLWQLVGDHAYLLYAVTTPDAPGVALPSGTDDRWRYGFEWSPQTETLADYPDERIGRLITRSAGVASLPLEIDRVAPFSFAAQIADEFRAGDVFLVGDAAHRITPRGGTGMNTAIADGFDLGWKLAWVLKDWAPASLLDSYEQERRPIVEHNLSRSAEEDGSRRSTLDEVHIDLRGRIGHHWVRGAGDRVSTIDLIGPGMTVFVGPRPTGERVTSATGQGPTVTVRQVDELTARAMGIATQGSLAVRPDGLPVVTPATASRSPRAGSDSSPRRSA